MKILSGCRHHPDCFTCPFVDCILGDDAYRDFSKERTRERHMAIAQTARADGLLAAEREYGVTTRTIYRALRDNRQIGGLK